MTSGFTIRLDTNVKVLAPDGADITPRGAKERALIAILCLSPSHRRRRAWLQDKLWSDRFLDQGRVSLRRALANIRKTFGAHRDLISSDKATIWLCGPAVERDKTCGDEFLDELDIRDPEFESWLRTESTGPRDPKFADPATQRDQPMPKVRILVSPGTGDPDKAFLENLFAHMLSEALENVAPLIIEGPVQSGAVKGSDCDIILELDGRTEDSESMLMVRLYSGAGRYYLWSSRFTASTGLSKLWSNRELPGFVNTVVTAVFTKLQSGLRLTPAFRLNYAVKQLFTGRLVDLDAARSTLADLANHDMTSALAMAWSSFERVTRVLEHNDKSTQTAEEAIELAEAARARDMTCSTIWALASSVELKMKSDPERAFMMGSRAVELSPTNAYGLNAISHVQAYVGQPHESYKNSILARDAGRNMPNDFCWDMQHCLAALGISEFEEAIAAAHRSYLKMPRYRPALRYLLALILLCRPKGMKEKLANYTTKLQEIEPDFQLLHLAEPDYPVHTLRQLDLVSGLDLRP